MIPKESSRNSGKSNVLPNNLNRFTQCRLTKLKSHYCYQIQNWYQIIVFKVVYFRWLPTWPLVVKTKDLFKIDIVLKLNWICKLKQLCTDCYYSAPWLDFHCCFSLLNSHANIIPQMSLHTFSTQSYLILLYFEAIHPTHSKP